MKVDYDSYKKIIFIDSNIVLEAKPLSDLPWHEIDINGPILVLMVPTVLREIDSKKRDGRLAVRARDFNRRIAEAVDSKKPLCVRPTNPRVDMYFSSCKKIDWSKYDDLDQNEGDCRVVAEILNSEFIDLSQVALVSQDIAPLIYATRHGLGAIRASEEWQLAPEQSPLQKENAKLKRQVADLSKTEPEIQVAVKSPFMPKIYRVRPLERDQEFELLNKIQALSPKRCQSRDAWRIGSSLEYDSSYDKKYEVFISSLPDFVSTIPKRLELTFGQIPIEIMINNIGKNRAENLHVEVKVIGGWINEKPVLSTSFPAAPIPELYKPLFNHNFHQNTGASEVGRHEVEVGKMNRSSSFTLQCADFRQGQVWKQNLILWIDPNFNGETKIITTITAANLHGEITNSCVADKKISMVSAFDLIDQETCRIGCDYNVKNLIETAVENNKFDDFEFDK